MAGRRHSLNYLPYSLFRYLERLVRILVLFYLPLSKLKDDENGGNSSASTETDDPASLTPKVKEKKAEKSGRKSSGKIKNKFETVSESSLPPLPSYSVEDVEDAKWDPADISLLRVLRGNFGNNFCTMSKLLNNKYQCKQVRF